MKKVLILSLALASVASLTPTARAGDKELAAIGGFIGGLILGSHLDNDRGHHREVVVVRPSPPPRRSDGHWQIVVCRVWVPARWVVRVDSCGRRVRHEVAGHYEERRESVWVTFTPPARGYDNRDRYAYNDGHHDRDYRRHDNNRH